MGFPINKKPSESHSRSGGSKKKHKQSLGYSAVIINPTNRLIHSVADFDSIALVFEKVQPKLLNITELAFWLLHFDEQPAIFAVYDGYKKVRNPRLYALFLKFDRHRNVPISSVWDSENGDTFQRAIIYNSALNLMLTQIQNRGRRSRILLVFLHCVPIYCQRF